MKIYKAIFVLISIFLISISCNKNTDFLIEKNRVGKLNKTTKVFELSNIFAKDSIVEKLSKNKANQGAKSKYFRDDDQYLVYDKKGKHLLTIIPIQQHDSLSKLKSVEIFSNRFKTKKGVSLYSPFKDIIASYPISITNTLTSAHIDIDDLNATMAIDKKEIGINEFNREKININQIPSLAKIKHFTVWFN